VNPFLQLCARLAHRLESLRALPPLLARLTVGWIFIESGTGKLRNLPEVAAFFQSLHLPHPAPLASLVALCETLGGIFLAAGLCTRWVSLLLLGILVAALTTVRWPELEGVADLLSAPEFLFALLLFGLWLTGPGPLSFDHWFFRRWRRLG
jgi:putative oxidoreductase